MAELSVKVVGRILRMPVLTGAVVFFLVFSGNGQTLFEPADLPVTTSRKGNSPLILTRTAFLLSGGWNRYHETCALNINSGEMKAFHEAVPQSTAFRITPLQVNLSKTTCRDSVWVASALNLPGKTHRRKEKALVNLMLGHFLFGHGPENILFHSQSEASGYIRNARILKTAIRNYLDDRTQGTDSIHYCDATFRIPDLISTLGQPLSVRHCVGSAEIVISNSKDSLYFITVMNTTSITSADFSTHLKNPSRWPISRPRCASPGPLSNTSQVFLLVLTREEMLTLAGRKYR
ncbi:MAG: hypothetical protein R6V49_09640 [Bacteroidales bacterium]